MVPRELESGEVVFAWTQVNGGQDYNMNCAAVEITNEEGWKAPPTFLRGNDSTLKSKNVNAPTTKTAFVTEIVYAAELKARDVDLRPATSVRLQKGLVAFND